MIAMDLTVVPPLPDLPTDVARLIIETAAWDDTRTAQSLACVSKLVCQWIDPILYHTVVIRTCSKLEKFHQSIISHNDPVFFTRHVKILRIGLYEDGLLENMPLYSTHLSTSEKESLDVVLSACRGLQRLAFWLPKQTFPILWNAMGDDGPSHLSVLDITTMALPRLPSLTHLHMDEENMSDAQSIPWHEIFIACPKLSHICLSGSAINRKFSDGTLLALIREPIAALPSTVTTFVILIEPLGGNTDNITHLRLAVPPLIEASDRLVVITHANDFYGLPPGMHRFPQDSHTLESDWGDSWGMDTWEFADLCIAERERKRQGSSVSYSHTLSDI